MTYTVERNIGERVLSIETGKVAKQANGSVVIRYGDTIVLVTAVSGPEREGIGFFPLTVEYREQSYAAGKIPGGFIKREGRPTSKEILTMRLIDRPIRPLFPDDYRSEVQVMAIVLSADQENDPDILGMIGSSAALTISDIPFLTTMGNVRVGRVNGEFIINPTISQREQSELDLVVASTKDSVVMVEGSTKEVPEEVVAEAVFFAHEANQTIIEMIEEIKGQCGQEKNYAPPTGPGEELVNKINAFAKESLEKAIFIPQKKERAKATDTVFQELIEHLSTDAVEIDEGLVKDLFEKLERDIVRKGILEGKRTDGRTPDEIRPITCEVGMMPRTHGSALFTRGETQAIVAITLGSMLDVQRVDGLHEEYSKKFMLHYNFPPFSVGEVRPVRGPGRREIGHGALAESAIQSVIPAEEDFPYTIRVVSDITESNGSSSMASVCGASLSLMDAGVPIKGSVAGIAMGLVKEGDAYTILSDIQGLEDHYGDMDFKITGTRNGITAIQMDVKNMGITKEIMNETLAQANVSRNKILDIMDQVISVPRSSLSVHAPKILRMQINPMKIGQVIGPGGKTIRKIQQETDTEISIDDDGIVVITGLTSDGVEKAHQTVEDIVAEAEVGKNYMGTVTSVRDFGAFVEILPGTEGLVHKSELALKFVKNVNDFVKVGDKIEVKVINIDEQNRVKLSRKVVLNEKKTEQKS